MLMRILIVHLMENSVHNYRGLTIQCNNFKLVQGGCFMQLIRRVISFRMSNPILSGLCHAFVWMLLGALILSLFLWMSNMREQELSLYTYVVHGLSLLVGGFVAGKRSGEKGWYHGGLTGIIYGLIVLLIGFLALDASFNWKDSLQLASAFLISALGGIFGVNTHRS